MSNNKEFILKKNIESTAGNVLAGTNGIVEGGFHCFPYIGRKYNDDNNGWLGNSFMLSDPSQYPEWFQPKEDKKEWEIVAINEKGEIYYNDSAIFLAAFRTTFQKNIH